MIAYHGSKNSGITLLTPLHNADTNLDYPCVYLTTDKAMAAVYIWDSSRTGLGDFKWMTYGFSPDGRVVYDETFKNGLREFYGGMRGYIYTCEGDFTVDEKVGIRHTVISTEPVKISCVDVIEDVYERLLQYEREGLLLINHFENLTEKQRRSNRNMVLWAINKYGLLEHEHQITAFVKEKYPEYWAEALENAANAEAKR